MEKKYKQAETWSCSGKTTIRVAPIAYQAFITNWERGYRHCEIRIFTDMVLPESGGRYYSQGVGDSQMQLTWQQGNGGSKLIDGDQWYAFKFELEGRDVASLRKLLTAGRKIEKAVGEASGRDSCNWDTTPTQVLDGLDRLGAVEVIHDSRISRYVPADECLPAEFQRYMDNYDMLPYKGVTVDTLARDEDEARDELLAEFGRLISERRNGSQYAERFQQWLAADKPVKMYRDFYGGFEPPAPIRERLEAEAEAVAVAA